VLSALTARRGTPIAEQLSVYETARGTTMDDRDELMAELALINRQLQASDEPTSDLVDALFEAARALKLPVDDPRDDTHRFIEGAEAIESATWVQCAGIIQLLAQHQLVDERALAARVAQRVFELAPTHY
jgi:hypothetical protein